jgi:hypothetical protein
MARLRQVSATINDGVTEAAMCRRRRHDRLDRLLRNADPCATSNGVWQSVVTALDDIAAEITSQGRRTPRRTSTRRINRRRGRLALVLAAAALVLGSGVAAGALLRAHTGSFPTPAEERVGGPGEALNPAAPDFRRVALKISSDIPYPPGYEPWLDFLISRETRFASDGAVESTGALHGWFAASAFCAWVKSWRRDTIAGDASAAVQAAQTISQATTWKAVTDEDAHPDPSAANDPGAETGTLFGWMLPYRSAVLAGDRARVEHLLATGYGDGKCWSSDPGWMALIAAHKNWDRLLSPDQLAQKYEKFLQGERP